VGLKSAPIRPQTSRHTESASVAAKLPHAIAIANAGGRTLTADIAVDCVLPGIGDGAGTDGGLPRMRPLPGDVGVAVESGNFSCVFVFVTALLARNASALGPGVRRSVRRWLWSLLERMDRRKVRALLFHWRAFQARLAALVRLVGQFVGLVGCVLDGGVLNTHCLSTDSSRPAPGLVSVRECAFLSNVASVLTVPAFDGDHFTLEHFVGALPSPHSFEGVLDCHSLGMDLRHFVVSFSLVDEDGFVSPRAQIPLLVCGGRGSVRKRDVSPPVAVFGASRGLVHG
jgi:hypothetical protein